MSNPSPLPARALTNPNSDYSGNHTKLPKILLNGNNICMVRYLQLLFGPFANMLRQVDPRW